MKASATLARLLSSLVLLFSFGVAVYRAKTQSIAHDEALTYEWFLNGSVYHMLSYNAANHVLLTLLAKPIVWAWGITEFHLRLPSLIGAAMYLLAGYLLSRRFFGNGFLLLVSVGLLCLNPQIVDFMPAARGYILGLACLCGAMCFLARLAGRGPFHPDDKGWRWGCFFASMLLGLSVVASFTNVVPVACLVLTFSIEAMGGFRQVLNWKNSKLQTFAMYFLVPGGTTGFCFLWPFVIQARSGQFKVGLGGVSEAVRNVFTASFLYKWTDDIFNNLEAVAPQAGSWQARVTLLGEYLFLPILVALVAFSLIHAWKDMSEVRKGQNTHCRIFGGAAIASLALIAILHLLVRVDYPISRYCLFVIPLFTLSGLLACRQISLLHPRAYLKGIGLLAAAIVLFDYALSLQTKAFRYTSYDVISRDLFRAIEKDAQSHGLATARVGGTWWYEPEINFYRVRYHAIWMREYDVKDKSYFWQSPGALAPADYDYFVFVPASDPGLTGTRIRTIFHDERTKATIIAISYD